MIKLILVLLTVLLYFILSIVLIPLTLLVRLINRKAGDVMAYYLVGCAFRAIRLITGVKVDVKGLENVPKDQPVLFVGNHRSYFDIILNYTILPPRMGFVAKVELKKVPFLNWWMMLMNCLFLDRSDPREGLKMINAGVEKIKNGISVFIFPEGTRAKSDDAMADFKAGSLKIAEKSGAMIVPVAINNTSSVFEDHFPKITKGHAIIEYGKPVPTEGISKEEKKALAKTLHDQIQAMVQENKKIL